jgi:hypothetical protein
MSKITLIGVHNSIKYFVREEDQVDLYYSSKTKLAAMSLRGITRMLGCNIKTVVKVADTLKLGKKAELLTRQGIQPVTFLLETEIAQLLRGIIDSRAKKETKNKAEEIRDKYVQAGLRLQVLLEVAPEVVAQEAISKIDNVETLEKVEQQVKLQTKYVKSYHGVHEQLKEHNCEGIHHASYNKKVNDEIDVPTGNRQKMTDKQRLEMTFMHMGGELSLMNNVEVKSWGAVNLALNAGKQALKATKNVQVIKNN